MQNYRQHRGLARFGMVYDYEFIPKMATTDQTNKFRTNIFIVLQMYIHFIYIHVHVNSSIIHHPHNVQSTYDRK